jgi:hypothetical protein
MSASGRFASYILLDFERVEGLLIIRADVQTEAPKNSAPNLSVTAQKPPLGYYYSKGPQVTYSV